MTSDNRQNYYTKKLPELMKEYDKHEKQYPLVLASYLDKSKMDNLTMNIRHAVEALIPVLPHIGGDASTTTQFLVSSAFSLPLFLALEQEGISMRDMAQILYQISESVHQLTPEEKRQEMGEFYFTEQMMDTVKKECEASQMRHYPEDWVFEFIPGDGQKFNYGFNCTECGIVKFYKKQNAERFVPILCLTDYANYRSLGVGFERTRKLATGDSFCDFRFIKGHITPKGWPPDVLEEKFPF